MPTTGGISKLEIAAIAARNILIAKNTYDSVSESNNYTATHTRALADAETPVQGKGTGQFLDIENYNAGGSIDIYGNSTAVGSGRNPAIALNGATWGYGPVGLGLQNYQAPNTDGNIGQVVF